MISVKVTLSAVISPRTQKVLPSEEPDAEFVGLEHIQSHTGKLTSTVPAVSMKSSAAVVKAGDVMYGRLRPYLNKVHLAKHDYLASGEFIIFPPSETITPAYLVHLLRSPEFLAFTALLDTGDRPRVNWNGIKNFEFLLPPVEIQQRIVETLEEHLTRLEKALADLKEVKTQIALYFRSFANELLSGAEKSQSAWPQVTLGEIAKWSSGGTPSSKNNSYYGGDIPWAVIGDLTENIVLETSQSITQLGLEKSSAKIQPVNTVMLAMYGASIGRTGIAGVSMATNQAIACAQVNESRVLPKYLLHFLQNQKDAFTKAGQGGAQPNISQGIIKSWLLSLPPIPQQKEICEQLDFEVQRTTELKDSIDLQIKQVDLLRRSLLHAAFTGQLNTEEPHV